MIFLPSAPTVARSMTLQRTRQSGLEKNAKHLQMLTKPISSFLQAQVRSPPGGSELRKTFDDMLDVYKLEWGAKLVELSKFGDIETELREESLEEILVVMTALVRSQHATTWVLKGTGNPAGQATITWSQQWEALQLEYEKSKENLSRMPYGSNLEVFVKDVESIRRKVATLMVAK